MDYGFDTWMPPITAKLIIVVILELVPMLEKFLKKSLTNGLV